MDEKSLLSHDELSSQADDECLLLRHAPAKRGRGILSSVKATLIMTFGTIMATIAVILLCVLLTRRTGWASPPDMHHHHHPGAPSLDPMSRPTLPPVRTGTDSLTGDPNAWFGGACGRSAGEARAAGCQFSKLMLAWLPADCLYPEDEADDAEFMARAAEEKWGWFLPTEATTEEALSHNGHAGLQAVNSSEAVSGEHTLVFSSHQWHRVHCTFVWRRVERALLFGRKIDAYAVSMHHTMHCGEVLLMTAVDEHTSSKVRTKYPVCM